MKLHLAKNTVDIWRCSLHTEEHRLLHPAEEIKAQSFYHSKDRQRYRRSRMIVKSILQLYLPLGPLHSWTFAYNAYGKPYLQEYENVHFNISHSHEHCLCIIGERYPLGVDIEYTQELAYLELARQFYADDEINLLQDSCISERKQIFFNIWSRKEAFIKAIGMGLSYNTKLFSSLNTDIHDPIFNKTWQVISMTNDHCAQAICIDKRIDSLRFYQWP